MFRIDDQCKREALPIKNTYNKRLELNSIQIILLNYLLL